MTSFTNKMKKMAAIFLVVFSLGALAACGQTDEQPADANNSEDAEQVQTGESQPDPEKDTIKIGTFSTSKIAADAGVQALEEMGYQVEVIVFDDAVLPNTALQEGSIDATLHQHKPYLDAYMKDNTGEPLTMLEPLIYYPNYGLYSTRYESLDEIPEGAVIGLYNDASNIDRGLRVLDACGLITLTDEEKEFYTTLDIVENPKNVTFYETAFGTAVRALEDVDACMATASHIQGGGLDPEKALALEDTNTGDFACGLVIRTADKDTIWAQDMLAAYTSDSCRDALNEGYQGASVPLF